MGNRINKQQILVIEKTIKSEPIIVKGFTSVQCSVKPNPIQDLAMVTIVSDSKKADVQFEMYDISGTKVLQISGNIGENPLDMSSLSNGAYILRVKVDSETSDLTIIKRK